MSNDWLDFTINSWGITLNTTPIYFNISWGLVLVIGTILTLRKIVRNKRK